MSASAYLAQLLADAPLALWDCQDASGLAQDVSGNAHHMTSSGGPIAYRDPGPFGADYAMRLGVAAFQKQNFFDNTMNNMGCEVWVQMVSQPTGINADLFANAQDNGGGAGIKGWSFAVATDLKQQVVVQGIAVESKGSNAIPSLQSGKNLLAILGVGGGGGVAPWAMVNAVRDAGTWKYYFNGALDGTHGTDAPNALTAGPPSGFCEFGDAGSTWDGRYAYVSYFNSATSLTAAKIAARYAAAIA